MTVNSINLAQKLVTTNNGNQNSANVAFRGGQAPDLDALRAKQDEFRRMSEQAGDNNGIFSKLGKFATKAIGVVIAFTAAKICLDKAASMFGDTASKYLDKAVNKATEKAAAGKTAEEIAKLTASAEKLASKVAKAKSIGSTVQKYGVNIIAGGAAIGTALKDFGLVNKEVSSTSENLVDNAIDKASDSGYNSYEESPSSSEFEVSEDEF